RGSFGRPGERRTRRKNLERPDVALSQESQLGRDVRDGDGSRQGAPLQGRERSCGVQRLHDVRLAVLDKYRQRGDQVFEKARGCRGGGACLSIRATSRARSLSKSATSTARAAGLRIFAGTIWCSISTRWTTRPDARLKGASSASCLSSSTRSIR